MRLFVRLTDLISEEWRKRVSPPPSRPVALSLEPQSVRVDVPPTRPTQRIKDSDLQAIHKAIDMAG